ncbi:uncharacterized protein A1O9_02475 [Exophiala aquamarina CBS 119918]|uniref:Seipin n=1 Tax=Exophiala aquamarina CBS 119918 TaxID=1182545 RepID=A0A072PM10_9EURO|nr:uncharacterized protein A1O9_02475 [Exophiala aquamarina CBS 119918]KEF60911.1 hypothetical protein A1O9_02475 [Exophiala aquamarina CBS 119918]
MADQSRYSDDEELEASLIQRAVVSVHYQPHGARQTADTSQDLSVAPIRLLTSRTAIKAYLSTLLFLTTSTVLLTISSTAYGFFYYSYIPQINLERVLYLQYGGPGISPHATTELDTSALISQQAYDVELILDMPRTPTNLEAGNFMLDLSLLGTGMNGKNVPNPLTSWLANITVDNVLHHSRRPAILPYASPIISLSHTFLHLPWHLLNFRDLDASHLVVPMFELLSFPRGSRNVPSHARLELQSTSLLQVYNAKLVFRAKFQGLRYLIYNYRVTAFALFTTLFYTVSITTMALAWALISSALGTGQEDGWRPKQIKQEGEDKQAKTDPDSDSGMKIKTEDDTEPMTPGTLLPEESQRAGLRDETNDNALALQIGPDEVADDEDDEGDAQEMRGRPFHPDSGIGTSMESEHPTSEMVRRRSSRGLASR